MKSFHIDLSHIEDTCGIFVKVRSHKLQLQTHNATTMAEARKFNAALAALPLEICIQRFTHFVNVPEDTLPTDRISWIRTLGPQQDPTIPLPNLITMSIYIPEGYQQESFKKILQQRSTYFPAVLKYYGLDEHTTIALSLDTLMAVGYLVTPMSTASALLQMHPRLSSLQPHVCHVLSSQHVLPDPSLNPDQYNYVQQLSNAIVDPNNQPWAPVLPCTNHDGSVATAQFDLNTSGKGYKTGDTLYRRDLHPNVIAACPAPLGGAMQTSANDASLQNQTWNVQHGTPVIHTEQPQSTGNSPRPEKGDPLLGNWAVNPTGMNWGVWLDVGVGDNDQLGIAPVNLFLRTLSTSIQYLDEAGNPIGNPTPLGGVPAACAIMGLPVPDTSVEWTVDMKGYSQANLIFGSLGRNLDTTASPPGALATGIFQILLPTVFFVAGVGMGAWKVNSTVQTIVKQSLLTLFKAAGPIAGWITSGKPPDSSQFFSFLTNLGIGLFMQIRSAQIQSLAAEVAEEIGEEELEETAAPDGGLTLRLISIAIYALTIGQTVIEVVACPAVTTVNFKRSCVATLTLTPDPAHGEAGKPNTAVWPAVADHYQVLLTYKTSGTTLSTTGKMQPTTNGDPITVTFNNVAAGAQVFIQVQANFYSSTGWLCGYWQSDWISVQDNGTGTFDLGSHAIKEVLVPLTQDSQYQFKEKIVYQITNGKGDYVWQAVDANKQPLPPPSTPLTHTDCTDNVTGKLCQLAGITLNTSAFEVGYSWRSAGHNLPLDGANNPPSAQEYVIKNLSVLQHPGSTLKTSLIGFSKQPAIAYSPVDSTTAIDQRNFILDPRVADTTHPKLHLWQVTLDDGSANFGLTANPLLSWGYFPIANLDAIAVHPDNAVIGVSYQYHKLMILNLDAAGADDLAPQAAVLSGKGLRQGLLLGPMAIAITADGRILILEAINTTNHPPRVQAFDLKGNPVACFGNNQSGFSISTTDSGTAFAAAMDQGTVPAALQTTLQDPSNLHNTFLLTLDDSLIPNLNAGSFQTQDDPVIMAFAYQGITLAIDSSNLNDHTVSSYITINTPGSSWTITDPVQNLQYQVLNQEQNGVNGYEIITQYQIHAIAPGQHWTLYDIYAAVTYDIQRNATQAGQFDVTIKQSFFSVQPTAANRANTTFLDLAVESKGFIYVLSYISDGSQPIDYYLDLYDPTGNYLSTVPDSNKTTTPQNIVAGKITVDKFRNLYSLNYETIANPPAGPEPSLSHWEPTTPVFEIPNNKSDGTQAAQDFNSANISVVINYFSQYGKITLNYSTTSIQTLSSAGYWTVKDSSNNASYQVIWSGDNLLVYQIPV
jgi:hypothetical protein